MRAQIRGADLRGPPRARQIARVGTHLELRERPNNKKILVAPTQRVVDGRQTGYDGQGQSFRRVPEERYRPAVELGPGSQNNFRREERLRYIKCDAVRAV